MRIKCIACAIRPCFSCEKAILGCIYLFASLKKGKTLNDMINRPRRPETHPPANPVPRCPRLKTERLVKVDPNERSGERQRRDFEFTWV